MRYIPIAVQINALSLPISNDMTYCSLSLLVLTGYISLGRFIVMKSACVSLVNIIIDTSCDTTSSFVYLKPYPASGSVYVL